MTLSRNVLPFVAFPVGFFVGRWLFALLALVLPWLSVSALASDYSNICRSADGLYEIDDEALRRVDPNATMPPIPYGKLRETVLARETGYCTARNAAGQQFKYETRSTALRARFTDDGTTREVDFICEFVADGLPAAYNCDKRVVTSADTSTPNDTATPQPRGTAIWLHNGSIMRLEASGNSRRFYYEAPRAGMRNAGVNSGTLLFEGTRDGEAYSGTAYIFADGCRPAPYPVIGSVSDGDRRVVMSGRAPRLAADCSIKGTRDDTLVFTFKPGEAE